MVRSRRLAVSVLQVFVFFFCGNTTTGFKLSYNCLEWTQWFVIPLTVESIPISLKSGQRDRRWKLGSTLKTFLHLAAWKEVIATLDLRSRLCLGEQQDRRNLGSYPWRTTQRGSLTWICRSNCLLLFYVCFSFGLLVICSRITRNKYAG